MSNLPKPNLHLTDAERRRILKVLRPFAYKRPWTRGWNAKVQAHFDGLCKLYRELGGKL